MTEICQTSVPGRSGVEPVPGAAIYWQILACRGFPENLLHGFTRRLQMMRKNSALRQLGELHSHVMEDIQ